jgi:hypothetical protein
VTGVSTVSVFGAKTPLREGEVREAEVYHWQANYYIGGQSARSFDVAWSLIDRLMGDEWASADAPTRCASLRFGNCVHVRVFAPGHAWHIWGALLSGGHGGGQPR